MSIENFICYFEFCLQMSLYQEGKNLPFSKMRVNSQIKSLALDPVYPFFQKSAFFLSFVCKWKWLNFRDNWNKTVVKIDADIYLASLFITRKKIYIFEYQFTFINESSNWNYWKFQCESPKPLFKLWHILS